MRVLDKAYATYIPYESHCRIMNIIIYFLSVSRAIAPLSCGSGVHVGHAAKVEMTSSDNQQCCALREYKMDFCTLWALS